MAAMTIRNLPDETHKALKLSAKLNGRSAEAEARAILQSSMASKAPIKLGTELHKLGEGIDWEGVVFERDPTPAEPANFD